MKYPIQNHRARGDNPVKGIVIHSMAEYISTPDGPSYAPDFLEGVGLGVHAMITPNGLLLECAGADRICPHAGLSMFKGLKFLNRNFLGVEVLVEGVHSYASFLKAIKSPQAFTLEQYDALSVLVRMWREMFDIPTGWVVGHSEVSGDSIRGKGKGKRDPGSGFDWSRLNLDREEVAQ